MYVILDVKQLLLKISSHIDFQFIQPFQNGRVVFKELLHCFLLLHFWLLIDMQYYNIQNSLYQIQQAEPNIRLRIYCIHYFQSLFQYIYFFSNLSFVIILFKLIRKMLNQLFCLFLIGCIIGVNSNQSLLTGKLTFYVSEQTQKTAVLRPLSQQPKIANIKNSQLQFVIISQVQSCGVLNTTQFRRDKNEPPVLAVIDFSKLQTMSCGMTQKINRIKEAGGFGFVIITDNQQFSINHCKMYDDNSFFTGVMDSKNYQILKDIKIQPLYGILNIQLKDSQKGLLEIWTSSLNSDSYDSLILLENVFNKLKSLKDSVEWRPRIASLGCKHGQDAKICNKDDYVASCACKGQFCSPEAHGRSSNILIQQDIRQNLIFKQYYTKYFSYIKLFKHQCLTNYIKDKYAQDCAANILQKLGINSQSINIIIQNFLQQCTVPQQFDFVSKKDTYTTLNSDKNAFQNYGRYPLLLLNKKIIEYKSEDDLRGQLCRKMQLEDQGCFQVSDSTTTTKTVDTLFYVLLVIVLMTIGAGVVYFYRKKLKRDMNKEIKMQVSTAVQHYFALTEVK